MKSAEIMEMLNISLGTLQTLRINGTLSIKEIFNFLKKKNWSEKEADKFFNYYESVGWKKGNNLIENCQATAKSWMLKTNDFKISKKESKRKKSKRFTTRSLSRQSPREPKQTLR